jgi:hypothetical protein
MQWLKVVVVLLIASAGIGCTPSGPQYLPVQGKVTVNGEPLKTGLVVFIPDSAAGNASTEEFRGVIKDGSYTLTGEKDGALAGAYRIAVFASEGADSTKEPTPLVDAKYNKADTSGLKAVVKPDATAGAYDFQVTK